MTTIKSNHFELHAIADGVFAAIHKAGGWAISNAGVIDLGDRTLVFDTMMTLKAAADLRKAAEAQALKPIKLIINSHYHNDHIWGNQVFDSDAQILSSLETSALFQTGAKEEFEWFSANADSRLAELRQASQDQSNEKHDVHQKMILEYYEGIVATLPELRLREPDLFFEGEMVLTGSKREVILREFQNAHTGSDVIAIIPDESLMFLSDLLFINTHPFFADGDARNLGRILEQILEYDAKVFVPGHGPIGSRDDVLVMQAYVQHCLEVAESIQGIDPVSITLDSYPVPEAFSDWAFPHFYPINLQSLVRQK